MECCDPGLIVSSLPGYLNRQPMNFLPAKKHGRTLWLILLTLRNSWRSVLELLRSDDGFSVAMSKANAPKSLMFTFFLAANCSLMNTQRVFHTLKIVLSCSDVKHCF